MTSKGWGNVFSLDFRLMIVLKQSAAMIMKKFKSLERYKNQLFCSCLSYLVVFSHTNNQKYINCVRNA